MKFAIVHPSLKTKGGAENVVVWLATALSQRGYDVTIITSDYDDVFYGKPEENGFTLLIFDLGGYTISPIKYFLAGFKLRKFLEGFDIINPHNFPSYIWCYIAKLINPRIKKIVWFCEEPMRVFYRDIIDEHVLMLSDLEGKKTISTVSVWRKIITFYENYGILFIIKIIQRKYNVYKDLFKMFLSKKIDRYVVPKLDLILTNSSFITWNIERIFKIKAIPCLLGIPEDRFNNNSNDGLLGNYMLTVARLFPEKNVENCIRAVKILIDENAFPFDKYIIAGTGKLYEHIKTVIEKEKLGDKIVLKGFVSELELSLLYKNSSLVVYLSLDETYGLVFPEAAYYKKAVIGPNHGGPTELIKDNLTGLLVDPLDPKAIAQGIKKISKEDLGKMGENNYNNYIENFTFDRFLERFISHIESIL